ncbi:hypothetical protein D3C77_724000 [compost metagenome]
MFDERRDKVLTGLLAVADDINARVLLFLQRQAQGVLFAFDQLVVLQFPRRPEFFRLCQPRRLGQAAGGGGGQ